MNTIHLVSSTSLVRSSEAIAVRNSFSFRSLMMRVMLLMGIMCGMVLESKTYAADGDNHTLFDVTTASNWEVSKNSFTEDQPWTSNGCIFSRAHNYSMEWSYVRIGGKKISNVEGYIGTIEATTYPTEELLYTIAKARNNDNLTINSITLYVYGSYNSSTKVFSNELDHVSYTVSTYTSLSDNSTIRFSPSASYGESCWASGVYFKLVFNLSNNKNTNYGTDISKIVAVEGCGNAPSTYTITYDPNGGDGTTTDSNSPYASGATVTVLANLFTAPDGMDFNGWNTAADGSGTYYDAGNTFNITENTTLYAQWITSGCRSVAFSSMGYSNEDNVSSAYIGPDITVSFSSGAKYYNTGKAVRVYNNGTFTVSSTNGVPITSILLTFGSGDGNNTISANTGIYSDGIWFGSALTVTFTVNYLQSNHRRIASIRACTGGVTLLYDANGGAGTMIDPNNPYTSGSTVITMTNDFAAPDDMDFNGWNTAADGSGDYYAEGASFTITTNTTLYAQWVAPSDGDCQQITFSEQGYRDAEEVSSPVTFGSSNEITATFSQGTNGSNAPRYYITGTAIRAYNGNTITVSVSGFNLITSIRLIFGDNDGSNTITTDVDTYNSGRWSGSETSVTFTIGGANGNRRIAGIKVCTAQPTSATVTYDGNGASGEVTDANSYDINATVTVLGQGNLENPCNTFADWNTAADGSGISYQEGSTFTITENVTLYAQWTPTLDYTITWLANGHFIDSHNFGCGSNINVANVPGDASVASAMCDGSKVFVGWSETEFEEPNTPSATIITREDFSDITVNGNKTYYAVFATRTGSPETCTLITNASTLTAGDSIVIVADNYDYAISTTQNGNNRGRASVVKDNEGTSLRLPLGDDVCVFGLEEGTIDGTWAFYDDGNNGYIYAAGTKPNQNYLRTQDSKTQNGSWTITISSNIATITAHTSGNNISNILRYNDDNHLFACYRSGQEDVVLYKKSGGYTYSAYTTFCPCAFDTDGIDGDNNYIWSGKNVGDDWGLTSNWVSYNSSETKYHLAANEPTNSTKVYIIQSEDCNIVTPTVAEDATCGNFTMNGLNIDIAENKKLTITGNATFTSGIINGNVVFGEDATVSGASTSSHVDGIVTKSGAANSTDFYFPTGNNGNLGKVEVTNDVSDVSVQYFSNPAGFSANDLPRWWASASVSGFDHVSNVEYWRISSTEAITANFVAEASTDMHFNSGTDEEDRNTDNIQMAFYDNNRWTNVGGSASIGDNMLTINGAVIPASTTRGISGNYTTFGSKSKSTILPIELTSFTAECDGKSSLIEWTTATEKNNDFFVLERSTDAINFKEIARVAGAGNSIEPIDYAYIDYGARSGDNYYRLVQVDYDGTSTASEIIVANCPAETLGEPEVLAFPNPFDDNLTLHFENFGNIQATIEVYDLLGRLVQTQKVNCSQNDYEVVLRLAGLSDGTYNVRISTADFVINRKVVKE